MLWQKDLYMPAYWAYCIKFSRVDLWGLIGILLALHCSTICMHLQSNEFAIFCPETEIVMVNMKKTCNVQFSASRLMTRVQGTEHLSNSVEKKVKTALTKCLLKTNDSQCRN